MTGDAAGGAGAVAGGRPLDGGAHDDDGGALEGGAPDDGVLDGLSFEQIVEALEATIAEMASGSLGIEEVTALYERAGRLHAAATERLARIQERIDRLTSGG